MASLQIATFAGAAGDLGIPDGPPTACKPIAAGSSGTVYGAPGAPLVCELSAIGGDVTITWTATSVVETLQQGSIAVRNLRGEAVSVA